MYLNAHSYFSLRYGTLSIEELITLCKQKGHTAITLTDINNSTGSLVFVKECIEQQIKPMVGIEFRNGDTLLYAGIARNREGFRELNEILTRHNLHNEPFPERPQLNHCYIIYPYSTLSVRKAGMRENEFIGIRPKEMNRVLTEKDQSKYIAFPSFSYVDEYGYGLHKQLRAIDHNLLISHLEKHQYSDGEEKLLSVQELKRIYACVPRLIENANRIIGDCSFDFDFSTGKNKKIFTGSRYDDKLLLEKLTYDGMEFRYGKNNSEAKRRIQSELEIIERLDFYSYFLITWDIIRYSMSRGFYHVGRGSGANSVVAYCLRITDVCPIELDLYFERFLNPKRKSPPDFDIDYSWNQRDEVQDYIFKRYGRERTALLGAMSTFRDRSSLRELGKVHGLPKAEIDRLVKYPDNELNKHAISQKIYGFSTLIQDFPNLRSIHAGGILISEEPLSYYTALDLPPKGFPTVQFDMYIAEDIGFEKLDILSQRGIGHIKDAADIVFQNRGIKVNVYEFEKFKKDEKVKAQLNSGDTIGCFYVESPAMRGLLKKLHCDNYLSLVATSSIIRPGVASSGMMREYIYRFHNPGKFKYLHPVMEEQLQETYGVMVYQEDVLKVCHHFGGLDLADADVLRRMMSGKGRSRKAVKEIKLKFFGNCKERQYPEEITREVWRQIESFAGYSFSKAHSASYAVESYQSLYLKAHFPQEFMVAVINNFGGFYRTRVYVNEARKCGAKIHLPCINNSTYLTAIYGSDLCLGFVHIQKLEQKLAQLIPEERQRNGSYTSLENFAERTGITLEQLITLIRVNALRFTGKTKKRLLWEAHLLLNNRVKPGPLKEATGGRQLFETPEKEFILPEFTASQVEDAYDEMELIGFPVTLQDFDILKTGFRGEIKAKELINHIGKKVKMVGSFVDRKDVRTKHGQLMNFGTFFDCEGNFFDTTHFPQSLEHSPFHGDGVYLILGKVVEEFDFPSLEVEKMAKLPVVADPRSV